MITCPGCQKTLPDWSVNCQFCGADTKKVVRPVAPPKIQRAQSTDALPWVFPVYYSVAAYWLLGALLSVFQGLGGTKGLGSSTDIFLLVTGGVSALVSIGLIARIEFFRGIVNVWCFIKIVFGLLGAWTSFLMIPALGIFGGFLLAVNILDVITSGLMIFLIGETDKRAPNL